MTDYFDLLREYSNPENKGKLEDANIIIRGFSSSCGDKFTFYIKVNKDGIIEDAKFEGEGCALSTISSSRFCTYIKGKKIEDIKKDLPSFEEMCKLIGIEEVASSRMGCVMLPVNAFRKGAMV